MHYITLLRVPHCPGLAFVTDIEDSLWQMRLQDSIPSRVHMDGESMAAWERALRPVPHSNHMLILMFVLTASGFGAALWQGWLNWPEPLKPPRQTMQPASGTTLPVARRTMERIPMDTAHSPNIQSRVQNISKCTLDQVTPIYSDNPCPAGMRTTTVEVKPDMNLAEGLSAGEREASILANQVATHGVIAHEQRVALNVDEGTGECGRLNAYIAELDAAARQPLAAFEQDQLRNDRKRARDRQFALRCG